MRPLFAAALVAALGACAEAQPAPEITEWDVPWAGSRPRDPIVDADGTVWFVGQVTHYVGRLDPASGEFSKYDLPAGAGPHKVIIVPHRQHW